MVKAIHMPANIGGDDIVSHVLMGALRSLVEAGFDTDEVHINAALGLVACMGVLEAQGRVDRKEFMADAIKAMDEGKDTTEKALASMEQMKREIAEALGGEKVARH